VNKLFSVVLFVALIAGVATTQPLLAQSAVKGSPALAAQSAPLPKFRRVERPVAGRYIVVFNDDFPAHDVPAVAALLAGAHGARPNLIFEHALKGFSVALPEAAAVALSRNPQVAFVEEVGQVEVSGSQSTPFESFIFWGLDRIDQRFGLDQFYNYNRVGTGVHVYVIDCGVWLAHNNFQGRAVAAYDAFGEDAQGDDLHGTAVAGIIGSKTWGVARNVRLYSVRVVDLWNGDGATVIRGGTDTMIAGINWVSNNHVKPAVINMSVLVPGGSTAVDNAVRTAVNTFGITFVTGAGNNSSNANTFSPSRVGEAITVAATDANDNRASYSNFGTVVDLFAPGGQASAAQYIPVPQNNSTYGREGFTGTSAAAPHVAGVAALYLEQYSLNPTAFEATPASVSSAITGNATFGAVFNPGTGTPNRLLYSGFMPAPTANPIDDTTIFVRQHYYDFLNRQPDQGGWNYWIGQITQCGSNAPCIDAKRVDVSRAFFESIEYRNTGYYVYRLHKASFGTLPRMESFFPDAQKVGRGVIVGQGGWEQQLETNKNNFAAEWAARPAFTSMYNGMSNEQYVDTLFAHANVTPSADERNALVNGLYNFTETRASVLRKVAENPTFSAQENNPAYVLMQYFGYLRRNPDDAPDGDMSGYNFWLNKLNGDNNYFEMIHAFIVSGEYRARFF
jgi:subtilisin family serine protease